MGKIQLTQKDLKAIDKAKEKINGFLGVGLKLPAAIFYVLKDIEKIDREEDKGLHTIGVDNDKEVIKQILSDYKIRKVHIRDEDQQGNTALHIAAGNATVVRVLVEKYRADVNKRNKRGDTPLFLAASLPGKTEIVKYLHEKGGKIKIRNGEGRNILSAIIADHHPERNRDLSETFKYLLKKGVSPHERDHNVKSADDIAKEKGKEDLLKLFKGYVNSQERKLGIFQRLKNHFRSLFGMKIKKGKVDKDIKENVGQSSVDLRISNESFSKGTIESRGIQEVKKEFETLDLLKEINGEFKKRSIPELEELPKLPSGEEAERIIHEHIMGLKKSSASSKEAALEVQSESLISNEPHYATIEEIGLSNVDAPRHQALEGEVSQKEPIYVSIEEIRAKKRFDRSKPSGSESPRVHSSNTSEVAAKQIQLPVVKNDLKPNSSLRSLLKKKDSRKERRFSLV